MCCDSFLNKSERLIKHLCKSSVIMLFLTFLFFSRAELVAAQREGSVLSSLFDAVVPGRCAECRKLVFCARRDAVTEIDVPEQKQWG